MFSFALDLDNIDLRILKLSKRNEPDDDAVDASSTFVPNLYIFFVSFIMNFRVLKLEKRSLMKIEDE